MCCVLTILCNFYANRGEKCVSIPLFCLARPWRADKSSSSVGHGETDSGLSNV